MVLLDTFSQIVTLKVNSMSRDLSTWMLLETTWTAMGFKPDPKVLTGIQAQRAEVSNFSAAFQRALREEEFPLTEENERKWMDYLVGHMTAQTQLAALFGADADRFSKEKGTGAKVWKQPSYV
jgi:hypothetical protein